MTNPVRSGTQAGGYHYYHFDQICASSGMLGRREGLGHGSDRIAIEPYAQYAPTVSPACMSGPEDSHAVLWTQSGGVKLPSVLGAGAVTTTSNR